MIIQTSVNRTLAVTKEELQVQYETYYNKKNIFKLLKSRSQEFLKNYDLKDDIYIDIISILVQREKRTSVNAIVEMLIEKDNKEINPEPIIDAIMELGKLGIVEAETDTKNRLYLKFPYSLTEEDKELIQQYCYQLPMIVKPLKVNHKKNNRGDGYYTIGSKSLILNNFHQEDICADTLNLINAIPYSINESLMRTVKNSWKSINDERSPLAEQEYQQHFNNFEKAVFDASAVMITNGNKFWFTHRYDFRGRIYCCGYQINYQGNSYAKAQVEFANKQTITEEINFF